MKIAIASDHAGYKMKEAIKKFLEEKEDIETLDLGPYSEERVDYPDYAEKVARAVAKNEVNYGILICGTGLGMSIAANKIKGIKAALCLYPKMAEFARKHNDANILVLAGRLMGEEIAIWTVEAFLNTSFEGGRHERRVNKIYKLEDK